MNLQRTAAANIEKVLAEDRKAPLLKADRNKFLRAQAPLRSVRLDVLTTPSKGVPAANQSPLQTPTRRIAVIGAGLAGLAAAYELNGLGYDVRVFEARPRVGGRVESLSKLAKGKTVEGGGELIGSNHALWNSYRVKFGLKFSDVKDYKSSPYRLNKHTLSYEQSSKLMDELDRELKALSDHAETLLDAYEPWSNPDADVLDNMTLSDWVKTRKCSKLCKKAIELMMAADNGIPANQQSFLGILAMVKGGGLDRYWTDTELYRCRGGNQRLAEAFRDALNNGTAKPRVECGTPVRYLSRTKKGMRSLDTWKEPWFPVIGSLADWPFGTACFPGNFSLERQKLHLTAKFRPNPAQARRFRLSSPSIGKLDFSRCRSRRR